MKAEGTFIFKQIKSRDGGEFTNQTGQVIKYNASHQVTFDEKDEKGELHERKIKVSNDQVELIAFLSKTKSYSWVDLVFDVGFNQNGCYLKLIDAKETKKNENSKEV